MKTYDQIYDELLVLKCQDGDRNAFDELVSRWQERLWAYAYRLLGEKDTAWDMVQETWMTIVKKINSLKHAEAFPQWIYRILSNKCTDWIRKQQAQRQLKENIKEEFKDVKQDRSTQDSKYDALRKAFKQLSSEQRLIISLKYAEGFDVKEISKILDIPEGTVKSRLYYARKQLQGIMGVITNE